ncbi:DNA polymerase III subunit alpha [Propionibacterium freudenreichii]|uniref:DNA polymerase III subunit alpha n=2 Tax=Propionibacterium freudenreichii TaxID=1744 RepID=UPI0005A5C828|nr:DNA polymerase III subunit alpha [Propionibacterium freudenreichii]CEI32061.1 DNA polymerase III alpha subunit [Propionibacterium freudenreichii]SCQ55363.1 DNA polymerase III, alpha subunit [Propionibacterium freudenreichii]SCQ57918.1 DNA polymerase III, alpha subunit [Propionibacterium freudenreichii]SCQ60739.1 DNA polymerase III, alpha subunit [Propionibacterium freudenreichii]
MSRRTVGRSGGEERPRLPDRRGPDGMPAFVHLRVASSYSLQYGASHPEELVAGAAAAGMTMLGLTDRDGLYGAVRFVQACQQANISPIVGVDLAVELCGVPDGARRVRPVPVKGGSLRDEGLPRVVVLARSKAGWAALCRLVTGAHQAPDRARPVATGQLFGQWAGDGGLSVLLGPDSSLGRALANHDDHGADRELARWRQVVPDNRIALAVSDHLGRDGEASLPQAVAMVRFADRHRLECVLTNQVRMARADQAPVCDVLDAARLLQPLTMGRLGLGTGEGWLKPSGQMAAVAARISDGAGRDDRGRRLLADTRVLAEECVLDPKRDIGLGEIYLPGVPDASRRLRERCLAGLPRRYRGNTTMVEQRLDAELGVIEGCNMASYFLTVAGVVDMVRGAGLRCTARGSGAGSLVNHLLGISGVDPMRYGLLMERFLSAERDKLPDIDLDVESARRTDIYRMVLDRFGADQVACVAMVETYRARHALRDVGAALSVPPGEIDAMAKAFPHIRADQVRNALAELPELRSAGINEERFGVVLDLVEGLDGLPRHLALHPCGVIISDKTLYDRSPVQTSASDFPMSQYDKDDVEEMGLLKLDVLGVRMQSAIAHALDEIRHTEGPEEVPDLEELEPFDDPEVYELIDHSQTLGCFQIESPGQRELVGKFAPTCFNDIIIDISLFRPGPVKADMVSPFLDARAGWVSPSYLDERLRPILAETYGVIVFHEQVIRIIAEVTGKGLGRADEMRRALGSMSAKPAVQEWFFKYARLNGYDQGQATRIWAALESFASFGFCKAHAASFSVPTYQSAWLKRHWPAQFLAGILTHDPGMYPKRLLLEEARRMNISVLGIDVNSCSGSFHAEPVEADPQMPPPPAGLPDARDWGIRLSLADVAGITDDMIGSIVAGQPYDDLSDFFARSHVSAPVAENLIMVGGLDSLYGIDPDRPSGAGRVTRRDLLLTLGDLVRDARAGRRAHGAATSLQGTFDFAAAGDVEPSGLPEMSRAERTQAELAVLGMDVSRHIVEFYQEMLQGLGWVPAAQLLDHRNHEEVLVAGVKVATQTPPVRSGRRVVFLSLDDSIGPVDATFFGDAQGPYASTVFSNWLLVVRGEIRRTGPRGISLNATGAWDMQELHALYSRVRDASGRGAALAAVRARLGEHATSWAPPAVHRMLRHPSGFLQSPFADTAVAGESLITASRKLWHASPGSSGG